MNLIFIVVESEYFIIYHSIAAENIFENCVEEEDIKMLIFKQLNTVMKCLLEMQINVFNDFQNLHFQLLLFQGMV